MSLSDKQIIFSLIGVGRVYPPKKQVLKDIYLSFYYGAKIGVLGLNGAGKSTLLRIIAGVDKDYLGEVTFSKGYTVGLLEQEPQLDKGKTVKEIVEEGRRDVINLLHEYEAVSNRLGEELSPDEMEKLLDKQSRLQEQIEAVNGWELEHQLEIAMDALRCPPPDTKVDVLSGGSSWLEQKRARLSKEEKVDAKRRQTLERELEWIRMSPKGRHAKGKARITRYEQLLGEQQEKLAEDLEIYIPPGPRLGDVVVEAKHLSKSYGDKLLFENLSFNLPRGGIVGVIGPNGAGKTTLFKLIVGKEKPDAGSIRGGETVKIGYVDQDRALDSNKTVWEVIADGKDTVILGKLEVNSRAYVGRFNFSGPDQQKKVKDLSGGERNRVHLARMLKEGANLMLLDEPTNDLDVNTLRALEEGLERFGGCCMVSSHDRWFLDRIATHILAFEGDSKVVWFEGNYSEYEADRRKRLGKEADRPHRIRYKKLAR